MKRTKKFLAVLTILVMAGAVAHGQDETPKEDPLTAAGQPTLITLKIENALWRKAFLALDEASGGQLEVPKADSEYSLPLSMEFGDVPFLKALDMMRRVAPVSYNTNYAKPVLQVNWHGNNERMDYVAYPGPARIMLANYHVERSSYLSFQSDARRARTGQAQSYLNMQVTLEPRLRIERIAIELTEMTDDAGRNLLEPKDDNRAYGRYSQQWRGRARPFNTQIQIHAGIPSESAKMLKIVKGKLRVNIRPDLPPLRLELAKEDQEIKMPDGVYKLAAVETEENGQLKIVLSAPPDFERNNAYRCFQEARLGDAQEEETRRQGPAGLTFRHREEGAVDLELRFRIPEGFKPTVLTIPDQSKPEDFEFAFEFADVPLPPLEAIYYTGAPPDAAEVPAPAEPMPPAPAHLSPLETMKASSFGVDVGQQPIVSVVDRIAAETGNPIGIPEYRRIRRGGEEERPSPAVTVQIEEAPFWQAMDDLCRKTGYRLDFTSRTGYDYFLAMHRTDARDAAAGNPYVQDIGPLRFYITDTRLQAQSGLNYQYGNTSGDDRLTLYINGQIWVEPRIPLVQHGASVEVCRAEDGSDLLGTSNRSSGSNIHRALDDPRLTRHVNTAGNPRGSFSVSIPLKGRAIPEGIAEMTIYYFIVTGEKEQTVEIAEPEKVAVYDLEGGGAVRWAGLGERNNRPLVRFGIDLPGMILDGDTAFYQRGFQAFDVEGKLIENLRPNANRRGGGLTIMTCTFNENQKPAKVVLKVPSGVKTYAGTVTFKDIELPEIPELPE